MLTLSVYDGGPDTEASSDLIRDGGWPARLALNPLSHEDNAFFHLTTLWNCIVVGVLKIMVGINTVINICNMFFISEFLKMMMAIFVFLLEFDPK